MFFKKGLKLQVAISLLVIFSVLTAIVVNWYSATNALKSSLKDEYLSNNYNYAKKITSNTQNLLSLMKNNLAVAAKISESEMVSQESLDLWMTANDMSFNSVFMVDQDGVIQIMSPSIVVYNKGTQVKPGMKIESSTMKEALTMREPFISEPYRATSGQLILLMSHPLFDEDGDYMGLIGGTIHLESNNALKNILNNHHYSNGSYVYVVDQHGHIIYHPDPSRITDLVTNNSVINKLLQGDSGTAQTTNSQGIEFFIGYSYEEQTGWGIVSQTPTSVLDEPLHELFIEMLLQSVPLLFIIVLFSGIAATSLSRPLSKLASFSEKAITQKKVVPIEDLKISSNIYEVRQLYLHIRNHIELLNRQIQMDGLTGIANRKTFDQTIGEYVATKTPFSLLLLDIDRFKKVNDTYGHLVGDEVIKYLAQMLSKFCREDDLCFRYGGEEFGILLIYQDESSAYKIAERLRTKVAETTSPSGEPVTISIGISSLQAEDEHPKTVIERADAALYQSKSDGRNRTTSFYPKNTLRT